MVDLGSEPRPLNYLPSALSGLRSSLLCSNSQGINHTDNKMYSQTDVLQSKIDMFLEYIPYWIIYDLVILCLHLMLIYFIFLLSQCLSFTWTLCLCTPLNQRFFPYPKDSSMSFLEAESTLKVSLLSV